VESRHNLWQLDELARRYGARPSAFVGLPAESWEAYQVDVATWAVGVWVEGKLAERKNGKPAHTLSALLKDDALPTAARFEPLASRPGVKRMAIPESGVW
jgi:hypothetical protein